ncbi:MFS transporter [Pseudonocardiaceae bacterium YIM PH 21723]|nr:MFS transporter [Pseudonocardiaceae bacterium YIM PH 21723]
MGGSLVSAVVNAAEGQPVNDRQFFGHPGGLSTLFFTEMWERFSYYGMRAILALYLVHELSFAKGDAASLVSIYGSAIYLSGIGGAWLADRVVGQRWCTFWGGVVIMLGHICLATPFKETSLYLGVLFLVIGTGLLKPNISGIVGGLYSKEDQRRDSGFTIFYMAVNGGAFLGQIVTSYLGEKVNWHWGFGAAAIGMAIGLIQYVVGKNRMGNAGLAPSNPLRPEQKGKAYGQVGLAAAAVAALVVLMYVLGWFDPTHIGYVVTGLSIVLPIGYFTVMIRSTQVSDVERKRIYGYIPFFLGAALFWLLFEQQASLLPIWVEERVDLFVGGWEMPAGWFQSFNPLYIVVFAPIIAAVWLKFGDRQWTTATKFAAGLSLAGVSYLVLVLATATAADGEKINILWLVVMIGILTVGELLVSPVGLSVTTKLAPEAFKSQILAIWFLAAALGLGVGGQVVKLYDENSEELYFGVLAVLCLVFAGIMLAIKPRVMTLLGGIR